MKNLIQYIGSYAGRREFIKKLAYGSAGLSFSSFGLMGCASRQNNFFPLKKTSSTDLGESRVSLVSGNDRRDMIYEAMKPFQDEIEESIRDKQVVIKLNCVGQNGNPLMVTHPDAVRGILDFLKSICDKQIIIAELMGIPWEYLGYLNYCETAWLGQADRSKIKIIGKNPMDHVIKYRLHDNIDWQLSWMDDLVVKK